MLAVTDSLKSYCGGGTGKSIQAFAGLDTPLEMVGQPDRSKCAGNSSGLWGRTMGENDLLVCGSVAKNDNSNNQQIATNFLKLVAV